MKVKERGFTLIELLVVLAIIGMLVSILIPSLSTVRNKAKETSQRSQFVSIEQALVAFKGDYGNYPPSNWPDFAVGQPPRLTYCGAQKLVEALLGWDMLGFHPNSAWRADCLDSTGSYPVYDATIPNLQARKGPYLDSGAVDVFPIGESAMNRNDGLYESAAFGGVTPLDPTRFVFTDVFKVRELNSLNTGQRMKAGSPILYYRANTSSKVMNRNVTTDLLSWIYDFRHNQPIVLLNRLQKDGKVSSALDDVHPLGMDPTGDQTYQNFYDFETRGGIRDSEVPPTSPPWPHRPDSFILISAGVDGLYGTRDDITNF